MVEPSRTCVVITDIKLFATLWRNSLISTKSPCTTYRVPCVVYIFPEFKLVDFNTSPGSQFAYLSNLKLCLQAFESARRSISQWYLISPQSLLFMYFFTTNAKICDL
ncbi:hypothetical protein RF11_01573 [Thelohanellus kitauei]|uniref:Uncharacterized protein n=1 Tax=Thelohanellus kitauei TaxID=669202 RepID=A0A0C2ML02_THEKT|nr:hypothetical protein RF11_01573 [Thelohanellus kitauei]